MVNHYSGKERSDQQGKGGFGAWVLEPSQEAKQNGVTPPVMPKHKLERGDTLKCIHFLRHLAFYAFRVKNMFLLQQVVQMGDELIRLGKLAGQINQGHVDLVTHAGLGRQIPAIEVIRNSLLSLHRTGSPPRLFGEELNSLDSPPAELDAIQDSLGLQKRPPPTISQFLQAVSEKTKGEAKLSPGENGILRAIHWRLNQEAGTTASASSSSLGRTINF
jgi:hypothetical protein